MTTHRRRIRPITRSPPGHRRIIPAIQRPAATAPRNRPQLILRSTLPVDDIAEPPRVLVQIELQIAVFVDQQLGGRIQDAGALALVLVIEIYLASRQVKALGLRIRVGLTEGDLAVGDELMLRPVGVGIKRIKLRS